MNHLLRLLWWFGDRPIRFLVLVIAFLVINIVVLPWADAGVRGGQEQFGPLDLRFGFTPEIARESLAAFGEAGRQFYLVFQLTGDVVYPVVYALLFGSAIGFLFRRSLVISSPLQPFALVPVVAAVFDLLENLAIVLMIVQYPAFPDALAQLGSVAGQMKWLLTALTMVLLLVGAVLYLLRRSRTAAAGGADPWN